MSYANGPRIITDGLVLHLDAANPRSYASGSNSWRDLSGNGNNGTLTNGPTYNTGSKGSIVFDGVNDSVIILNSPSIAVTGDISIFAWVNITNYSDFRSIASKTTSNIAAPYDFYMSTSTGLPSFVRGNGNLYGFSNGTVAPAIGKWQYVGVTMAGTTVNHYLNGASNTTNTLSTTISNDASSGLYVGYRVDNVTKMLGNIGQVLIYNRALSAAEIKQNYNATKGRYNL